LTGSSRARNYQADSIQQVVSITGGDESALPVAGIQTTKEHS
jgi:hypothetical protein